MNDELMEQEVQERWAQHAIGCPHQDPDDWGCYHDGNGEGVCELWVCPLKLSGFADAVARIEGERNRAEAAEHRQATAEAERDRLRLATARLADEAERVMLAFQEETGIECVHLQRAIQAALEAD